MILDIWIILKLYIILSFTIDNLNCDIKLFLIIDIFLKNTEFKIYIWYKKTREYIERDRQLKWSDKKIDLICFWEKKIG